MATRRFLVRPSDETCAKTIDELETAIQSAHAVVGCAIGEIHDLSLVNPPLCCAVEVDAPSEEIARLVVAWQARGLRIDDADQEVRELEGGPSDENPGGD